ncbi:hypothetical protein HGG76_14970 [Ochrobactrum tritici]|uniref:Uncharacterized protein n=1 Tax=Brucella tritici TaxID=94626 RepID=A0A7X6JAS0_9HYPH|nr:hypothetical protein [Brucella tritici]
MADLPILFSAPMVRAILREIENPGTGKTQTRRIIKPQPTASGTVTLGDRVIEAAEWQIREGKFLRINEGDRLYVREAWRVSRMHDQTAPRDLKPRTMTVFFEAEAQSQIRTPPATGSPQCGPKSENGRIGPGSSGRLCICPGGLLGSRLK